MKAIDGWHRFPWQRQLTIFQNEPRPRPSIIVGIEVDVGTRPDWHKWWPRPLGIVQWTMASSRGHPIMLDTLRRVSEAVNPYIDDGQAEVAGLLNGTKAEVHRHLDAVVEKSGPGPFTDSVLRCRSLYQGNGCVLLLIGYRRSRCQVQRYLASSTESAKRRYPLYGRRWARRCPCLVHYSFLTRNWSIWRWRLVPRLSSGASSFQRKLESSAWIVRRCIAFQEMYIDARGR